MYWNPAKSQVLDLTPNADTAEVNIGGVPIKCTSEVEYLGLRLDKNGFLGKEPKKVEEKGRAAIHMLVNATWFDLNLEPKHIVKEYMTYVRSILVYGAELLTKKARVTFIEIDERLINPVLLKLLKLGPRKLARRHQLRTQLALGLSTLEMAID